MKNWVKLGAALVVGAVLAFVPTLNTGIYVANNTELKGLRGVAGQTVVRAGFASPGDGGGATYTWDAAACTNADDGYEVAPTAGGGCFTVHVPPKGLSVKVWGATGDNATDDAPAFRAACTWALSSAGKSMPILVPSGTYRFNSLEADGGAAVYLTTGNADGAACSLVGPDSAFDYASAPGPLDGPATLVLGNSMNRPLLRHKKLGASSHIKNLTLHGNKTNQAGWAGGPGSKLFVVQIDNATLIDIYPETGIIFDDVVIEHGYNGNLFVGNYRYTWGTRLWSQYAGQGSGDYSVWVKGYDSTFWLPAFGNNSGCAMLLESGSQYQIVAGAMWQNTVCGLEISGYQVNFANIWGTNFHANPVGIKNTNNAPFNPGDSIGAVTVTNGTFDQQTTADIEVAAGAQVNRQMVVVAPSFIGNSAGGAAPTYNIKAGGGVVEVVTPRLGTAGAYATAFTDTPVNVFCSGNDCPSTAFVPILGDGTPTYVSQVGWVARNGTMVHVDASVTVSNLGGAAGALYVGDIPWFARTLTGGITTCPVGVSGWTAPANYDWLTGTISSGENSVILRRNSASGQAQAAADAAEFAASTTVSLSCDFPGAQ